ncbi:Hypothetical protein, putative [Bodo saltans]|uniref:Impact N-terminal domain-containing protein n=1 Tax=Bodo saltans TaxID=75058 RepID=A0A0S4KG20_BODSA|nr:Hypothetical protein, putative [Bodo saltans]|eukprot:CUI14604.1 Hypothetical protein, putative [Bodo saltans]
MSTEDSRKTIEVVDLTQDDDDVFDVTPSPPSPMVSAHSFSRKRSRSPKPPSLPTSQTRTSTSLAKSDGIVFVDVSSDDDDDEVTANQAPAKGPQPWELVLAHVPGVSVFDKLALQNASRSEQVAGSSETAVGVSNDRGAATDERAIPPTTDGVALLRSTAFVRASAVMLASSSKQQQQQSSPSSLSSTSIAAPAAASFVPNTAGSSSPFFRAPSQAVQLRQRRIALAGLAILRLPSADVISDNGSIFDSFVVKHAGLTTELIHDCLAEIRSDAKVSLAAHPGIFAYRLRNPQGTGQPIEYSDDNGEDYAGKKILDVLRTYRCEDCLVVVVRWFGGKLLGPRRFTHISNVTRRVLERHSIIASPASLQS